VSEARTGDLDDLPQAEKKDGTAMTPAALRADCKNFRRLASNRTGPGKKTILLIMLNKCCRLPPSQRRIERVSRILTEISPVPSQDGINKITLNRIEAEQLSCRRTRREGQSSNSRRGNAERERVLLPAQLAGNLFHDFRP